MSLLVEMVDFSFKAVVVMFVAILSGVSIVRYAVDYAYRAKQQYMSSMIDKATKVGANIDLGIQ